MHAFVYAEDSNETSLPCALCVISQVESWSQGMHWSNISATTPNTSWLGWTIHEEINQRVFFRTSFTTTLDLTSLQACALGHDVILTMHTFFNFFWDKHCRWTVQDWRKLHELVPGVFLTLKDMPRQLHIKQMVQFSYAQSSSQRSYLCAYGKPTT